MAAYGSFKDNECHCGEAEMEAFVIIGHDSEMDISDYWMEKFDPQNEFGSFADAFFVHSVEDADGPDPHRDYGKITVPALIGIKVQTGTPKAGFHFVDMPRHLALELLGKALVDGIEELQMHRINGQ